VENLIKIILIFFATYRLSSLISSEEGPYISFLYKDPDQIGVFKWIRKKLGAYDLVYEYDERGNQRTKIRTNLGRGISCPLCVGAYVAAFLVLLMSFPNIVFNLFIFWLGVWGVQTFLENLTSDDAIEDAIQDVADSLDN
jgi:hypothetical protein